MTIRRMLAAAGIGLALSMAVAAPASAHDFSFGYNGNTASLDSGHRRVWVADQGCNPSRPVFVQYYRRALGGTTIVLNELYAPCGGVAVRTSPTTVVRLRLCETIVGCSGWRNA
jgi:hypothetical protein